MTKKNFYTPRLILFGNIFKHDVLNMTGGYAEEYDLTKSDFGEMGEANILLDFVNYFKGDYTKAMVIYVYKKEGLVFHHIYNEGPCFEIRGFKHLNQLYSIADLLYLVLDLSERSQEYASVSKYVYDKVKELPKNTNNINLQNYFQPVLHAQAEFLNSARLIVKEYIDSNFVV